ncbi:retron Ec48 family effector membrane protein [Vibrio lentus]
MMNNLLRLKIIIILKYVIILFIFIMTILTTVSIISTIINGNLFQRPFCFTNNCLKDTYVLFEYPIKLALSMVTVLTSVITSAGIFIALLSYFNITKSNALNNHIAHFKIFNDYVIQEIEKRDMLNVAAFDIFKWYNTIFEESRFGSTDVSKGYIIYISELSKEIEISNEKAQLASSGSYSYKEHQRRIIPYFERLGILLTHHPRNDFNSIEQELVELVDVMNKAFCFHSNIKPIPQRKYI